MKSIKTNTNSANNQSERLYAFNIGKKYLKTAIIIDESLIHAIVSLFY
jgi:hypothetical protein